jgi:uncharacterized protein YceH (UPF0502 family)
METASTSALQAWLPTVVATGALGLIWLDLRRFKLDVSGKVEKINETLKRALYREDGTTNYIPRTECEKEQLRCRATLCGKIDAQTNILNSMESKRDRERETIFKELQGIAGQVGNLSGKIDENHKHTSR